MNTVYQALNKEILTGITSHLLNVDQLPPSTDVETLAREISGLVFKKLNAAGLTAERIESIAATNVAAAKAQTP